MIFNWVEWPLAILIGVGGFLILLLADLAEIKSLSWARLIVWICALVLFAFALGSLLSKRGDFSIPTGGKIVGWIGASVALLLAIYSVFIEIPIKVSYLNKSRKKIVITTGTYALTRHPGVLWYTFLLLFLVLATGSKVLLVATPIWIAFDILHVFVQDKFFFIKIFGEPYRRYSTIVPMLIPNRISIRRCLRTLWAEEWLETEGE